MSYTATTTPVGLFASQFSAFESGAKTDSLAVQLLRPVGRALVAFGQFLGGAYPRPRVRRMIRAYKRRR